VTDIHFKALGFIIFDRRFCDGIRVILDIPFLDSSAYSKVSPRRRKLFGNNIKIIKKPIGDKMNGRLGYDDVNTNGNNTIPAANLPNDWITNDMP
jgi:hypothetical protein